MVHGHKVAWWEIVHAYPCPECHAAPGQRCVTTTGHPKSEPHAARARVASEHHWRNPDDEADAEPEEANDGDDEPR